MNDKSSDIRDLDTQEEIALINKRELALEQGDIETEQEEYKPEPEEPAKSKYQWYFWQFILLAFLLILVNLPQITRVMPADNALLYQGAIIICGFVSVNVLIKD